MVYLKPLSAHSRGATWLTRTPFFRRLRFGECCFRGTPGPKSAFQDGDYGGNDHGGLHEPFHITCISRVFLRMLGTRTGCCSVVSIFLGMMKKSPVFFFNASPRAPSLYPPAPRIITTTVMFHHVGCMLATPPTGTH